ncbi:MAG: 6-carboxytetrahydropterin synthase QueD [Muribaculaceae bacterium]|nr:6-carboxytetrahydropterin synthase QueD [Muribaculaceae bacterium]
MYYVNKRLEISGAHSLSLSYPSKCSHIHGHNWIITVFCKSASLNQDGMVVDFSHVKQLIHNKLDHRNLNEIFDFNPTAENIARWICDQIETCYRVEIQESEGNIAIYDKEQ